MKTKKIIIYVCFILAVAVVSSCSDFLDIEPQQAVDSEFVYDDHEGVVNALHGAYSIIAGPQFYAGTSIFHSDLVANSGEIAWTGTFIQYLEMELKAMDPSDGFIEAKWINAYRAIDIVNNVLENLHVVNESDRNKIEGEAKFIRGIMYLELVRFFANPYIGGEANEHPGVPLVLIPTPLSGITDEHYPERASVGAVYDNIINDLNDAKNLLSAVVGEFFGANDGKATGPAAAGFLARAYLDMELWEEAAIEADYVIEAFGGYNALNPTPRAAFNNDSYTTEDVFMIMQNAISHAGSANNGISTFFASLEGQGRSDIHIMNKHFDIFEEGDLRAKITDDPYIIDITQVREMYYLGVGRKPGNIMSSKWGKFDANINVIRLAEMILTRAEANFRNGTAIGAQPEDDINSIRNRAGLNDLQETLTLQEIRNERYRELCFEGHRLFDVRRFKEDVVNPTNPDDILPWNSPRMVLPIPQREIDVNENLVQNEAYQ